jgi:ATP-dependent Lhr-like helicase
MLLDEGRAAYAALDLGREALLPAEADTHVLTWRGTAVNSVLSIVFIAAGLDCEVSDIGVTICGCHPEEARAILRRVAACPPIEDLAQFVGNLRIAKYDDYVSEALLRRLWARRNQAAKSEVDDVLRALYPR